MNEYRRVLLDTSVVIDLEIVELGDLSSAEPAVSAVTVGELAYGIDTKDPVQRHFRMEKYQQVLQQFHVIPFGLTAAKLYGVLATLVRQAGRNPRPRRMDLQIAATAAADSLPFVTRNPGDFKGLEKVVEIVSV